ncbi:MAG: dihydrolipoyl dehydrogenase [Deltaproteobacteria bacterium]|nr:dihydrolipoyl dehydrogenase [Deltaproteobacteria bacterium]MBW2445294.1 dihydrolipoyl dehydrogenase [Deltaproteobacteria bacterium]
MSDRRVDVAVIGAGTAGLNARSAAAKAGASTVLIEGGTHGTTCARVGCMPSKLLIAAAEAAHGVADAGRFGIEVSGPVRVDGPAVLERVRRERDRFVGFVLDSVERIPREGRLDGHARFVGPTSLEVEGHGRVDTRAVVLATGSSPFIPPALDAIREHVLVNDDVFELPDLPESLAVVGAGVIALELGQAFARLGVRVSIFARSQNFAGLTDPAVRESAAVVLGCELTIHRSVAIEVSGDPEAGFRVRWRTPDGAAGEESYQHVLAAAGRKANLAGLGLERAGLALDARGRLAHDPATLQVGSAPVFLAGDVTAEKAILHEAADEGRLAGANAAHFPKLESPARRAPLSIAFTEPQIAGVGARFADLDLAGARVGAVDYADQGRARVMGRNAGVVRIYGECGSGVLLGAEMVGPRVEHTAHLLAWAIQSGLTVDEALARPFYHPVIEEGIQTALRNLAAELEHCPPREAGDLECGPGN